MQCKVASGRICSAGQVDCRPHGRGWRLRPFEPTLSRAPSLDCSGPVIL
jgi:hypothetical protein